MRIGVFGGTFDPVHTGHLLLAENAIAQAGLDRVLFMPAYIQPFKQDAEISPPDERIDMLRLALSGNPRFGLSSVEIDRGGISYTIDSLKEISGAFSEELAGQRLSFILGTDMFFQIGKWHDSAELLRKFGLIVGVRPGYADAENDEAHRYADFLRKNYDAEINLIGSTDMQLSSSQIRERLAAGESLRYILPEGVRRYMQVREKESASRWEHTKSVISFAADLAVRYGENVARAETAALLHDYCKDSTGGTENNLSHGASAAKVAVEEFGVDDEDVLNAIRYHTTGRAGMSRLEKIIFVADTLAPGRDYERVDELRELAFTDLNVCILEVLVELEKYVTSCGYESSRDSREAIAWLLDERQDLWSLQNA